MKEYVIEKNDAGQRMDRWLSKNLPVMPSSLAQKYIRLKRVKVNRKGVKRDTRLQIGDLLQLYINDEFFEKPTIENAFLSVFKPQLDIIYEDDNLLLLNKPAGLLIHPDSNERVNTLLTHMQAYLYQKKAWSPYTERSFTPAFCNRIDRNTGGIVIAAKNAQALRIINEKISNREINKYYLCIIHGRIKPANGILENYLVKDENKLKSSVHKNEQKAGKLSRTEYQTLEHHYNLSLMHCHLITGRTHQIRAQFAGAGHPLMGDPKYGVSAQNKKHNEFQQALYSYKLSFTFKSDAGPLSYLNNKTWTVTDIPFVKTHFPNATLPL